MNARALPFIVGLMACCSTDAVGIDTKDTLMIDFSQAEEIHNWTVTNDSVMGGLSSGGIHFGESTSVFSGEISLENNGGFTSINRPIKALAAGLDTIELDVEGDGFIYQLRASVLVDGYRMSYKHEFPTEKGERTTLSVSLHDFQASFRGRIINDAPTLTSEDIQSVGFLLANKRQGPFTLVLHRLKISKREE